MSLLNKDFLFFCCLAFQIFFSIDHLAYLAKTIVQVLAVANKLLNYSKSSVESDKLCNHYQGNGSAVGDTGGVTIEFICPSTQPSALVTPFSPNSAVTHSKTRASVKSA
jgi:hypothetical protein